MASNHGYCGDGAPFARRRAPWRPLIGCGAALRLERVLARVGGDEFAVLLTQTGAEQARIVAEGIVECVRRDEPRDGERSIRVTASVGVALLDGLTPEEIMDLADRAMYEAKAAGRDRLAITGFSAPANNGCTPSASSQPR